MRRTSFANTDCTLAGSLEIIGEWWTMLIIREALTGYRRFEDFRERLGIARNILTRRLRHLEANGILERVKYHDRPPRYEYVLTQKGKELGTSLMALAQWGNKWKTAGDTPSPIRFNSAETGAPLEVRIIDTATDEPVYYKSVVVTPPDGITRHPGKDSD
ncbi:winged helix-turn-helix transcriptional regulator [Pyruvatibacter sp. HU-CL02332]|uniref:winged helix-turn-helix transcriptional regulator n=1 Tax=Pyruvatibacter sp. HU-CL02332 TaxID=3127650 RepID=UPI0029687C74|nr:helix-turn-helix domain-containing protein [Alphaproteobacteria bacterium]